MPLSRVHLAIVAAFAAIYLVWGSTYLALALALQSLPPFTLMAARCLVGGAILYGAARAAGASAPPPKTCLVAAICGVLFFVGCHGVLVDAQQRVHSGLAAVLLATIPLWLVLLQVIFPGRERPTWSDLQTVWQTLASSIDRKIRAGGVSNEGQPHGWAAVDITPADVPGHAEVSRMKRAP